MANLIAYFRLSLALIVGISLIALVIPEISSAAFDLPADNGVISATSNVPPPINLDVIVREVRVSQ